MIIPIPIYIRECDDDLDYFDYTEGFGEFFIAYLIGCVGTIPLTYSIIGCINGFDAWGLVSTSICIGSFAGVIVIMICDFIIT